jgi:hypothetical protein
LPITPFLDGHKFDAETKRVRGVAFEMPRPLFDLQTQAISAPMKCSPEGSSTLSAILIFCAKVKEFREQRFVDGGRLSWRPRRPMRIE